MVIFVIGRKLIPIIRELNLCNPKYNIRQQSVVLFVIKIMVVLRKIHFVFLHNNVSFLMSVFK